MATALDDTHRGTEWIDETRNRFRVSRTVFIDEDVLAEERDRIFSRCWLYIGHSSELPAPNDYVRRSVGGRDLIFNRDRKGQFHAFFNSCPHRGAAVVRDACGTAVAFKCFYHGWSFNNNGNFGTRFQPGTYPEDFNSDGCANLKSVAHLAEYRGFWFVNFDPGAGSLEDYLADAKDYLDIVADHGSLGMEIVGGSHDYSMRANWKLLVENSIDGYHALETHSTYLEYLVDATGGPAELFPSKNNVSRARDLGNGHAVIEGPAPWGRPVAQWVPAWGEKGRQDIADIYAELEARLGKERADQIAYGNRNLVIFPNLIINDIMAITVRTFYPERPDFVKVTSWALAPVGESREFRKRRLDNFLEFLGPGGFATPDDNEALEACQSGYRNSREVGWNDISRGMEKDMPAGDDEAQMRAFWRGWGRCMTGGR